MTIEVKERFLRTYTCTACRREVDKKLLRVCSLCGDPGCPLCMEMVSDPDGKGKPHYCHRLCVTISKVLMRSLPIILKQQNT